MERLVPSGDKRPSVSSFEELACWREAGRVFAALSEALEGGGRGRGGEALAGELLARAAGLGAQIAASFDPSDPDRFKAGLGGCLASARGLLSLVLTAHEAGLVSAERLEELRRLIDGAAASVKEHMAYLTNLQVRRLYREMEEL